MKIIVFGGGNSPERDVSMRSAKSVANGARRAGYEVIEANPKDGFSILDDVDRNTIIFPILHGAGGEDGQIQSEFEKRKLAYLGSDSSVSAECFDKWLTRQKLVEAGLPMPKAARVSQATYHDNLLSKQPHVLKVLRGGSSIGTLLVKDPNQISPDRIDEIFRLDNQAVLEELIEGTEATVPILDKTALPVIEIVPPPDEEFDYENKYNGRTQEICPPKTISTDLQLKIQKMAEKVHITMGAKHLSRVDIMIISSGDLFVLEINTIPGLTDQSLYPKAATAAGLSMPELVKKLAELVQRDFNLKN